ncbi:MAG: peptide deformylase [Gammaproteobacteria bacterium]|nr:peptide deformylase [Gammaproteobacteria bacterium]
MPNLLKFVEKTDPILRETMPEVQDFNDPTLHEMIKNMCYSILPEQLKAANGAHESAAGMAANQWGIKKRIFIFTPDGSQAGKRLEVMINPSYLPYLQPTETTPEMVAAFEGCFSVPLTTGIVNRYEAIMATYYNLAGEKIECLMEGWEARVFQHETDHLDGKLFDGQLDQYLGPECLERIIFKDKEEMRSFWEDKVKASRDQSE